MTDPTGSLATALSNAQRLLATKPALAEEQAREILNVVPGNPHAAFLLVQAMRAQNNDAGAFEILQKLVTAQPNSAAVQFEFGSVMGALGKNRGAVIALSRAADIEPNNPAIWRALGDQHTILGETDAADRAYARNIRASVNDPKLIEAATALVDNRLAVAERILRDFLKAHPTDVSAIRMLAETGARLGRLEDAETLLARALELAPGFTAARHNYASVLHRQSKSEAAIAQCDLLLREDSRNPAYRALKAAALVRVGEYQQAITAYEKLLKDQPQQPKAWMSYAHTLKTVGRPDESIAAYRQSIALLPSLGESFWSMANLKTFRFADDEIAGMRTQLARHDLGEDDRLHFEFALGKALEDAGDFEDSFAHYKEGNALRRKAIPYDADAIDRFTAKSKEIFTRAFFDARAGYGTESADPIFIVGMPRAGSTLVEQILASHSQIEGTMELPDLLSMARRLGGKGRKADMTAYLEALPALDAGECAALGEEFLSRTRVQRKENKPFFIDKMPNNFHHIALIHLMLPNAKIIDARRHPLGCCFSNFKQHFAQGQAFAYDLAELGRYYADYVELMVHYDAVLPGRIHRVFHEAMVADPEAEVGKLLDYCGLAFEESCLRHYENSRPVRTASAQQVREPINAKGVDQWRNYEPWLEPLKSALGPVLDAYPAVPVF